MCLPSLHFMSSLGVFCGVAGSFVLKTNVYRVGRPSGVCLICAENDTLSHRLQSDNRGNGEGEEV